MFQPGHNHQMIMTAERTRNCCIMLDSVRPPHGTLRSWTKGGEPSFIYVGLDKENRELCPVRPDRILTVSHPHIVDCEEVDCWNRF